MKKLLIAGAALATLIGTPVFAADMAAPVYKAPPPAEPVWSWTGFYIGANGGYGWGNTSTTATTFQSIATPGITLIPNQAFSQKPNGPVFGGQVGYNFQVSQTWLLGIEGDFDSSGLNKSSSIVTPDPLGGSGGTATDGFQQHSDIRWLATIRGRLGWTSGPNLFYVTGGGAWENLHTNVLLSADTSAGVFSQSAAGSFNHTYSGWVAGLGYERMITANWIVRAEYLHYGFQGTSTNALPIACPLLAGLTCGQNIASSGNRVDVGRLGLSYKF